MCAECPCPPRAPCEWGAAGCARSPGVQFAGCVCVYVPGGCRSPAGTPVPAPRNPTEAAGAAQAVTPGSLLLPTPGRPAIMWGGSSGQDSAEPWDRSGDLGGTGDGGTPGSRGTPWQGARIMGSTGKQGWRGGGARSDSGGYSGDIGMHGQRMGNTANGGTPADTGIPGPQGLQRRRRHGGAPGRRGTAGTRDVADTRHAGDTGTAAGCGTRGARRHGGRRGAQAQRG